MVNSPANGFPVSMTINEFPTGKPWRETKNKNQSPTTELRHRVFIWVSSWEMTVRRLLFSLMLELETLPLPALLLWAHGMMWSSHMLISKKFYRLPHSTLEPFSNKLSVGIGCKSSWRYFCNPPAHLLGNVIVLGHVLSQSCLRGPPIGMGGTGQVHVNTSSYTQIGTQSLQRSRLWGLELSLGILPNLPKLGMCLLITYTVVWISGVAG